MVQELTNEEYETVVKNATTPVVIDFFAEWCGPCKMYAPTFEEVSKDFEGKVTFVKVNVDDAADIAGQFGIQSIPTTVFVKNGEEVDRAMGALGAEELKDKVNALL